MSASPTISAAVPSQKRPLEDTSSPSGQGQPDAKRPALDKVVRDEAVAESASEGAAENTTPAVPDVKTETKKEEDIKPTQNGKVDHQGDTVVADAPAQTQLTQPIESTANSSRAVSTSNHAPVDESQWLHVRAIISSAEAATVIGSRGENVSVIRQKSGAKCTISEYTRGAVERILTVSGAVESVAKAFGLIIRTLNQEDLDATSTAQSKTYPLRLLVPHILIGSVIGKGGARIKEIQSASSARLNASESCLPLSTERSLVVLGVADAVHIATYYIGQTLMEQLTERFGGPAASAYATRSGQPTGAVPGGMQVIPYVPQSAAGQWGHPDNSRRHNNAPVQRAPANPYGAPNPYGQPPQQAPMPAPMHFAAPSPQRGYQGAGPQQPPQYGGAPQYPQQGPHGGMPQQPMQGGPMPPQAAGATTQQIFIPNDMVGAIIGKGGAKINEIRQMSGSVIKINEPQDNSNERLVTITGTPECNQMALYMLYTRLGECKPAS